MHKKTNSKFIRRLKGSLLFTLLVMLLAACGGQPPEQPRDLGPDNGLGELIAGATNGEVDAEVTIEVSQSLESQTLTTLVIPEADTPLIIEATGTTKAGKDFKVVFYGPAADLDLLDFSGKMRLRAQVSEIQSKQALLGAAVILKDTAAQASLATYPFIATSLETEFQGPAAGTVYELRGNSDVRGVCGSETLAWRISRVTPRLKASWWECLQRGHPVKQARA